MHIFEYLVTSWWKCLRRWWKRLGRRALLKKYNTKVGLWHCMEGPCSPFNLPVYTWQWDQPACCFHYAFLADAKSLLPRWTSSFWNCKLEQTLSPLGCFALVFYHSNIKPVNTVAILFFWMCIVCVRVYTWSFPQHQGSYFSHNRSTEGLSLPH